MKPMMRKILLAVVFLGLIGEGAGRIVHSIRRHKDPRWNPYMADTDPSSEWSQQETSYSDSWTSYASPILLPRSSQHFSSVSATHDGDACPKRPRNWRSLFGKSRCKKKCKTAKNCGSNYQSKLCLCDAECGMSCVKKNLNCPPLLAIKNGYLTYTANFPFDSTVAYSCEDHFVLLGNAERRCQGNGQWSGGEPTCVTSAKCGPPPEIPFAQHASYGMRQFDQGSMVSYHCVNGYYLSSAQGLTKAKCLPVNGTAVWYGPEMICSPISCGHPGDPVNGDRIGDSFQYPNTVRYKCHDGFVAHGSLTRRCLPVGRWSGEAPTCQPVQCPKPDDPIHGRVFGTSLDYRASITYTCEEGHRLVGQRTRQCQADRTWSGQAPRCEEIHCDSPPAPENGYIEGSDTAFGAEIVYRCLDDIEPRGARRARCQRDGTWSFPPPQCLANCRVPHIEHGQSDFGPAGRIAHHGLQLRIECQRGYEPDSSATSDCDNGKWIPAPPRCVPIRCSDWPKSFPNSMVLFAKSDSDSVAKYICKAGYKMKNGNGIFRCTNGNWTGNDFYCEEITCPNPRKVEEIRDFNGSIKLEGSMGTYEYHDHFQEVGENRQIQFDCPKGFMLIGGPNKATCLNGTWRPKFTPVCVPQEHPQLEDRPDWSNLRNKRSADLSSSEEYEIVPMGSELRPYLRLTRKRRSPSDNSQYVVLSVRPPKRKRRRNHRNKTREQLDTEYHTYTWGSTCPPIRENERQKYDVVGPYGPLSDRRFQSGSEVGIRCEFGYELPNPDQNHVTCKNGTWVPQVPMCAPKNCKLPVRPNGFFTWRGEIVNSVNGHEIGHREGAKLFCLRGYELRGDDALECNLGSWLKTAGECVPQSCAVPVLRYGHYKNESVGRTSIEHASKLDFQCQRGYHPNPMQGEVHCSHGTLKPHAPECNEDPSVTPQKTPYFSIGCTRPYDIDNAWVYIKEPMTQRRLLIDPQLSVFPNRTIVHYKCSESMDDSSRMFRRIRRAASLSSLYTADEAHAIECTDGEWVALLVECAPSGRPPPGVDFNSTQLLNVQLFGANKLPCTRPNNSDVTGIVFETNDWLFLHGFRLRVHCANDESKSWFVRCRRGLWKGFEENSCAPIEHPPATTSSPKQTCDFNPTHFKNMIVFYEQRKEPIVFKEQLPEGAHLTVRCQHVGLYQFTGTKKLVCRGGSWQGGSPRCRTLGVPWKEGQAPPIAYRATEGDLSLTNDGDIVLRKSSTLELDCLMPKQRSQPYWDYSNSYRKYPQQWAQFILEPWETGNPEETNNSLQLDAFRLTIFMARPEDSGIFHCITPGGLRHSVRVRVVDVDCPNYERLMNRMSGRKLATTPSSRLQHQPSTVTPNVQASKGSAFGSVLHFTCPVGYKINGATRVYCLEHGEWSHETPICEIVRCPMLTSTHPAMEVNAPSNVYDSIATFSCAIGFQIHGPPYVQCNESGDWSDPIPKCRVATCLMPDLPNGARIVSPRLNYTYGDVARFMCEQGYMQTGRDFAVCNQHGLWSNPPPECQRICLFPGMPKNGDTTSAPKRTYQVGNTIVYDCKEGYTRIGRPDLKCLPDGQWSADIPKCRPKQEGDDLNIDFAMRPYVLGG